MKSSIKKIICQKCKKELDETNFWNFKNSTKDNICKECIINSEEYNISTQEGILNFCKRFDIPFIKKEWNRILKSILQKQNQGLIYYHNYKTLYSKYLALMKLPAYRSYVYYDSNLLEEREGNIKMTELHDNVNHPTHYNREDGMECIDEMVLVFGKDAVKHFCLCNVWKYRYRAADKNGEEDLKKSDFYMKKYKELCSLGYTD